VDCKNYSGSEERKSLIRDASYTLNEIGELSPNSPNNSKFQSNITTFEQRKRYLTLYCNFIYLLFRKIIGNAFKPSLISKLCEFQILSCKYITKDSSQNNTDLSQNNNISFKRSKLNSIESSPTTPVTPPSITPTTPATTITTSTNITTPIITTPITTTPIITTSSSLSCTESDATNSPPNLNNNNNNSNNQMYVYHEKLILKEFANFMKQTLEILKSNSLQQH
jgi:hypothetical protein